MAVASGARAPSGRFFVCCPVPHQLVARVPGRPGHGHPSAPRSVKPCPSHREENRCFFENRQLSRRTPGCLGDRLVSVMRGFEGVPGDTAECSQRQRCSDVFRPSSAWLCTIDSYRKLITCTEGGRYSFPVPRNSKQWVRSILKRNFHSDLFRRFSSLIFYVRVS